MQGIHMFNDNKQKAYTVSNTHKLGHHTKPTYMTHERSFIDNDYLVIICASLKSSSYDKDRILQYKRGLETWFTYQYPFQTIYIENTVKSLDEYPKDLQDTIPEYVEFYALDENRGNDNHCVGVIESLKHIIQQLPEIRHAYKYIIYNEPRHVIFQPNIIYQHLKYKSNTFCAYEASEGNAYYFGNFVIETETLIQWLENASSPVERSIYEFLNDKHIPVKEVQLHNIGIARYFKKNRAYNMGNMGTVNGDSSMRKMAIIN